MATELGIKNAALRRVGSPLLETGDTTSHLYTTVTQALDDANLEVFGENVFAHNTKQAILNAQVYDPGDYDTHFHAHYMYHPTTKVAYWAADLAAHQTYKAAGYTHQPPYKYQYHFQLPFSYNAVIKVEDASNYYTPITDYEILYRPIAGETQTGDAKYIHLDGTKQINVHYTYVPNTNTSDYANIPDFIARLLTLHTAQSICIELTGDNNRHEILYQQYLTALKRARVIEARQGGAQTYIGDGNSRVIGAHQNYGSV
jgi:hypothetical protein